MDVYKLKCGVNPAYKIDCNDFERRTNKEKPYYMTNSSNEIVQYAVCPRCDNPVQIIGFYKKLKNTEKPFGKHLAKSINKLATYNHTSYLYCPYRKKQKPNLDERKEGFDDIAHQLYATLREQFDRVIYLLEKDTGIAFTENLARSMLDSFIKADGFLYKWAVIPNLPWIFGCMSHSQSLFGKRIKKDSDLHKALQEIAEAEFTEKNQITSVEGKFLSLNFCFLCHEIKNIEYSIEETVDFRVTQVIDNHTRIVFEKRIIVDQQHFLNLISLSEEKAYRNQKWLDIAKEMLK